MKLKLPLLLAALTAALALTLTASGKTITCPQGFLWGGQGRCWTSKDGAAFRTWLVRHGGPRHPWRFAKKHPELAAIFGKNWLGVNWEALERDFHKALHYSADRFHVSYDWLHDCAHGEGGHTPGYISIGAAGEHGWFQYLPSTFGWMSAPAFRVSGHPPAQYHHVDSVVGQTWTAGYAMTRGWFGARGVPDVQWFGRGC